MGIKIKIEGQAGLNKGLIAQIIARALASEGFADVKIVNYSEASGEDARLKEAQYRDAVDTLRVVRKELFQTDIQIVRYTRHYNPNMPVLRSEGFKTTA